VSSPSEGSPAPGSGLVLLVAALSGAAVMVVELAAVRLLAPWFGTSLVVWTNVIAVILLALAIGYLLGARLAARAAPLQTLALLLGCAALMVAWLPVATAFLARHLVPEEVALHEAAGLVSWGSLALSLGVFLPPATLLGTVSPLVVEALSRARGFSAGRAGGSVLAVSTLGSLAGVFATSHLLLPGLGLRGTFWLAAGTLFVAAMLAGLAGRRAQAGRIGALALLACGSSAIGSARPVRADELELARRESSYQSLRVVAREQDGVGLRFLQVNEGFDSFQSVWQAERGPLPEGFYYNDFLLPLSWSEPRGTWRLAVLGLGAGTALRVFAGEKERELSFIGVELDPVVVDLGREHFELAAEEARGEVWSGLDARLALRVARGSFDQIVLDCYSNQVEIPPHLCTLEFFREARARLVDGGWLSANVGGFDFSDPVVQAVARTCASAFEAPVLLVRVPSSRNFMLLARRNAPLPHDEQGLGRELHPTRLALGPRLLPAFTRLVAPDPEGDLLTDDHCPIEILQQRSIREARARRMSGGA